MTGRERKLAAINARRLKSTIRRVEQQPYDTRTPVRQPRLGAGKNTTVAFCQLSTSLGPATGTWPSITPTTQGGITPYVPGGGTLTSFGSTVTVYNYRNVTWAANKTTLVIYQDSWWVVVDQDC